MELTIRQMSAGELAATIRSRQLSPVEAVETFLTAIERDNPALNAYCLVDVAGARAAALAAEQAIVRGDAIGPLHGVPVSVKDSVLTRGLRTTRGSAIYRDDVPAVDAPVVARLRAAGAIVLGKTTAPELSWKAVTDSPLLGVSANPWDLACTPGGSSGGAAAAVAARLGPLAVGTDAAGSVRIPASFCGVVGLKPSHGRVPFYPPSVMPSLAHIGPLALTVADAALFLEVTAGPDPRDAGSLPRETTPLLADLHHLPRGTRLAWSPDLGLPGVVPEVAEIAARAAERFAELGCVIEPVALDWPDPAPLWQTLFGTPCAAQLAPLLPRWRAEMDPGLVALVEHLAAASDPLAMGRAILERSAYVERVRAVFERYDLLLTPTLPVTAFSKDTSRPPGYADDPDAALNWSPFTIVANLTGQPAISVPCGWTAAGMPVGLQILGPHLGDRLVLQAGAAFEALAPWRERLPPLLAAAS